MKDIENQNKIDELQQKVNAENALGPGVMKQNEIQAELNNQQINLNAKAEEEKKAILNQNDAMQIDEADVQKDGPVLQKKDDIPEKPAIIEDPAERMKMLENLLIQTQAQIRELNEQNKKMSQILLASMENKKKEEKEKEEREEAAKEQQKEKKEEKKEEKKPRLNADQIDELLAERIERHEKRAEKAAKGKYDGKVMLNGMQPKYYYAAVRDFHKDMQEKIGRIDDPKKREQYFAQYYNQKRMMAYVKHRATDPVYQRMVDKLKADKVLDTYEKARYARSPKGIKNMKPFGRGYGADGEVDRIHAIDTDRELFQNGKNEKKDWKDFKDAVQKYNEKIDALAKEGKYNGDEARQAAIEFNNAAHNYILENMGDKSQAEYVKEARAMRQYTLDVFNESIAYANLRYDCRAVVEDAAKNKKTKLDYTDPLAAADLIIAKNMLSDNPNAKKFWESIPNDEQITPEYTKSAVKNFQKAREDVITNPFFNMTLLDKQGKSLNDFPADYNKLAAKQTEKIKQDQLKSAKQKEKELKKMLKQQEKLRKAEEKKMKKEGKKKEEVKQVIRPA